MGLEKPLKAFERTFGGLRCASRYWLMYTVASCKLRKRITVADMVPIIAVPRPQNNFQMVQIDLIGPIDPPVDASFPKTSLPEQLSD